MFKTITSIFLLSSLSLMIIPKNDASANNKIAFWDKSTRHGGNYFNKIPDEKWFKDASAANIEWIRLSYDKWQPEKKDFLIGDASNYNGLVKKDLEKLKQTLSWAEKYNLKVVITPLSLPGSRWLQNNDNKPDSRIWNSFSFQEKATQFWVDLAKELKEYSCIVAYDILNEPAPEVGTDIKEQTVPGDATRFIKWDSKYKGTTRDLHRFYQRTVKAIRKVDPETPIMVESGFYAQPPSYNEWETKINDNKILYSFHMYEPYSFTSIHNLKNGDQYSYPDKVKFGDKTIFWDKKVIGKYLEPFYKWTQKQSIPANRIVVSEFGCVRKNKGAEKYLEDILSTIESKKYHWAFYSYREDAWDGYDYELGTKSLPLSYWNSSLSEKDKKIDLLRKDNSLFEVIKKRLK